MRITRPYLVAVVPVTHEQFAVLKGDQLLPRCIAERRDWRRRRRATVPNVEQRPLDTPTGYDAVRFCNLLSARHGFTPAYVLGEPDAQGACSVEWHRAASGYRLPTESELEHAAAARGRSGFPGRSVDAVAWHRGNWAFRDVPMPHPVALWGAPATRRSAAIRDPITAAAHGGTARRRVVASNTAIHARERTFPLPLPRHGARVHRSGGICAESADPLVRRCHHRHGGGVGRAGPRSVVDPTHEDVACS